MSLYLSDPDCSRTHWIFLSCIIWCLYAAGRLYPDWRNKIKSMKASTSLSTLPTENKHHSIPVDTNSLRLSLNLLCKLNIQKESPSASVWLPSCSMPLFRGQSACEADLSFTWQARTASWILWNSNSLVMVLSKKFSLVSSFLTGPLQLAIQTQTPISLYSFIICNRVKLKLSTGISLYTLQFWKMETSYREFRIQLELTQLQN